MPKQMTFTEGLVVAVACGITIGIFNLITAANKALFLNWFSHFAQWMAPAFKWLDAFFH